MNSSSAIFWLPGKLLTDLLGKMEMLVKSDIIEQFPSGIPQSPVGSPFLYSLYFTLCHQCGHLQKILECLDLFLQEIPRAGTDKHF